MSSTQPTDAAELDLKNTDRTDGRPKRPAPLRHRKPGVRAKKNEEPAGFGVRLVAAVVDGMILGIPIFLTTLIWGTLALSATDTGSRSVPSFGLPLLAIAFSILCLIYFVLFLGLSWSDTRQEPPRYRR